jgi:hypothetical protein
MPSITENEPIGDGNEPPKNKIEEEIYIAQEGMN